MSGNRSCITFLSVFSSSFVLFSSVYSADKRLTKAYVPIYSVWVNNTSLNNANHCLTEPFKIDLSGAIFVQLIGNLLPDLSLWCSGSAALTDFHFLKRLVAFDLCHLKVSVAVCVDLIEKLLNLLDIETRRVL